MPPPGGGAGKSYAGPKMDVQVEIDDGVHTIPEVIRDVRLLYGSNASLMLDRKNYQYYLQVPITRGLTRTRWWSPISPGMKRAQDVRHERPLTSTEKR